MTCATRGTRKPAGFVAAPANTWNVHLQVADNLLLVIHGKDVFADTAFADEASYYKAAAGTALGTAAARQGARLGRRPCRLRHLDAWQAAPHRLHAGSGGVHRIWYTGGRWAYVSALLDGFTDFIFMTVDMSDPANPREAGRYWLPGMNLAAGETPTWAANAQIRPAPRHRRTAISPGAPGATPALSSWTSPTAPIRS